MKIFLIFLFAASMLQAQTFTPETAAIYALRHNRELAAARFAIQEAEARLIQAGLWSNPEFEVSTDFATQTLRGNRLVNVSLSQKFPLAGRLEKMRAIARVDVALAIAELQNQERLLVGNVLAQARALLVLDRKTVLQTNQLTLLDRIQEQTANMATNGTGDATSLGVVHLERATLALQRDSQIIPRQSGLDSLAASLGLDVGQPFKIVGTLPEMPQFIFSRKRPDLQMAILSADRTLAEEKLARVEKWEDLTIGVGYTRERDEGVYDNMAQLRFSVPLPLWNRNQGRIAEVEAAHLRAVGEMSARFLAMKTEINEAQNRATNLRKILAQTEGPLLALARQNTALVEQTAAAGFTSFLTIYESRRQHLNLSLAALETQSALVAAITDWQTRTGEFPKSIQAVLKHPHIRLFFDNTPEAP